MEILSQREYHLFFYLLSGHVSHSQTSAIPYTLNYISLYLLLAYMWSNTVGLASRSVIARLKSKHVLPFDKENQAAL